MNPRARALWWHGALALLLLNALLTVPGRWPAAWAVPAGISIELVLATCGLALWTGWRGQAGIGVAARWLAGISTLFIAAHAIDAAAAALLGRPLNVYWDAPHAASVLQMSGLAAWQVAVAAALLIVLLVLVHRVVRACWQSLGLALLRHPRARGGVLLAGALLVGVYAAHDHVGRDTRFAFARPVAPSLARQVQMLVAARLPGTDTLTPSPGFARHTLAGLQGADVLLMFSESYGACTFDDPAQAAALAPARERLARQVQDSGRGVVSARLLSPTFGGSSWLAHAAVLAGVDTREPGAYERLLASHRPSLVGHFQRHGWRTVNWMPGLHKPWPEGRFWGFERYGDASSIGYQGLPWGYWRVPDQAALALLHAQELEGAGAPRQPRFMVMATVASHMPFVPLPPLLPDGARAADAHAYTASQLDAARQQVGTTRTESGTAAYLAALQYNFAWLGEYLERRAPRELLTIVVGDHQPWAVVSGSDASWDVPVHIISSDAALLDRLVARGFVRGMTPPRDAPARPMHELTALLLDVFDAPGAEVVPAAE